MVMDLASFWLSLRDVRLHDSAADVIFRQRYDPLAAAFEEKRCHSYENTGILGAIGGKSQNTVVPPPRDCVAGPDYSFLEWSGKGGRRYGWVGQEKHIFAGPMELETITITRVNSTTLAVTSLYHCGEKWSTHLDLHLLSKLSAWAMICGTRVDLVQGEGIQERRDRWDREMVDDMLGNMSVPGLVRRKEGWIWNHQPISCQVALLACDPTSGVGVACNTPDGSYPSFVERDGVAVILPNSGVNECALRSAWGGIEIQALPAFVVQ